MPNVIILWSGSVASIPSYMKLSDGTDDTHDLTDRFVAGVGGSHTFSTTGGTNGNIDAVPSHSHSLNSHAHSVQASISTTNQLNQHGQNGIYITPRDHDHSISSVNSSNATGNTGSTSAQSASTLPSYYALCYVEVDEYDLISGMIAISKTATPPTGWNIVSNSSDGYLLCKNTIAGSNLFGGNNTLIISGHTHTANHNHATPGSFLASASSSPTTQRTLVAAAGSYQVAIASHTHSLTASVGTPSVNTTSGGGTSIDYQPQWIALPYIMKT